MSPLEFVEPSKDLNVNVLLYGGPKTGKTVGACTAPGPVLLVNADTPNATRYAHAHTEDLHEIKVHGLQTLIDVVNEVNENPGKYKSAVVDPVGELHRRVIEGISGRAIRPKLNDYGDVSVHIERFCRALCDQPLTAVFVAHETSQKDEDSGAFERLPWTGTNNPALGSKIMSMVDIIGYTGVIQNAENADPNYVAQLLPGGGRKGGARFGDLGAVRDVNINEWVALAQAEPHPEKGAALSIKLDNIEDVEAWSSSIMLAANRWHNVKVETAEETISPKAGVPQVEIRFANNEGDIREWMTVIPESMGRVKSFLEAVGVPAKNGQSFPVEEIHGKELSIFVGERTYTGGDGLPKTTREVKAFASLAEGKGGGMPGDTRDLGNGQQVSGEDLPF